MKTTCKKSKRWISLIFCVLMMIPMLAVPAGAVSVNDFKDVPSSAWYYDAVKYSVDKGIFAGMSKDTFEPQTALTRGMFVQTMANLTKNYAAVPVTDNYFTDIPTGAWYGDAANWAYNKNLISGTAEKTFSAATNITREQAATILYAYAMRTGGYTNLDSLDSIAEFSDFNKISDWAIAAMIWAVEQDIMVGVGENMLDPKGTLTRAQAAQLFTNIEDIIDDEPFVYTQGIYDDLGLNFEETIGLTYSELVEKLGEPVKVYEDGDINYYTFETYPNVEYIFDMSKDNQTEEGTPAEDVVPVCLSTTINTVMPDIAGLTFGEATKLTEGGLYIYYEPEYYPDSIYFDGIYYTENYTYCFLFDGAGTINGDCQVLIYNT